MRSLNKLGKIFTEHMENNEQLITYGKDASYDDGSQFLLTNKAIYSTRGYKIRIDNLNINMGHRSLPGNLATLEKKYRKYELGIEYPKGNIQIFNGESRGGWHYIVSDKKFIDEVINITKKPLDWRSLFGSE